MNRRPSNPKPPATAPQQPAAAAPPPKVRGAGGLLEPARGRQKVRRPAPLGVEPLHSDDAAGRDEPAGHALASGERVLCDAAVVVVVVVVVVVGRRR